LALALVLALVLVSVLLSVPQLAMQTVQEKEMQ
jgi:hypothetical protein